MGCTAGLFLESVIVGDVLHDFFYGAFQNVAEFVNCVYFYVLIMAQTMNLGAVDIVMRVQIILRDTALLHRFPKTIVPNHNIPSRIALDFFLLSP